MKLKNGEIFSLLSDYLHKHEMSYWIDGKEIQPDNFTVIFPTEDDVIEIEPAKIYCIGGQCSYCNEKNKTFECMIRLNDDKSIAIVDNRISIQNVKCYIVHFTINKETYTVTANSHDVSAQNIEAFAWGVIRSHLESKNIPLEGIAVDVVVRDTQNVGGWSLGSIDISSCIDNLNN